MEIRNADDLRKYLEKIVESANKEVAEEVVHDVKASISKNVYGMYRPEVYQRTYALHDSVGILGSHFHGNTNTVTVGHDVRMLSYMSVAGDTVMNEGIPNIIIKGQAGAMTEKGYWKDSPRMEPGHTFALPRDYITPVKIGLINTYEIMFKKALRNQTGNKVL